MLETGFSKFNLSKPVLGALQEKGWTKPTEIQRETLAAALAGNDLIGQAQTGSGKTAAFGIPIIESTSAQKVVQSLILCPTRELAIQVADEIAWLQGNKGLVVETVYGGTDLERQAKKLKAGADIIVGTPGRVIDMSKRGHLSYPTSRHSVWMRLIECWTWASSQTWLGSSPRLQTENRPCCLVPHSPKRFWTRQMSS